jgi:hypothetical protein
MKTSYPRSRVGLDQLGPVGNEKLIMPCFRWGDRLTRPSIRTRVAREAGRRKPVITLAKINLPEVDE